MDEKHVEFLKKIETLRDSLKGSNPKVITTASDGATVVELLDVQMTRDNLNLIIDILSSFKNIQEAAFTFKEQRDELLKEVQKFNEIADRCFGLRW